MPTSPPSITTLPSAPDPNNRTTFNTLAYPWSAALPTFGTELSAVAANAYANALEAESSLQAIGGRWAFDSTTTMADPGTGDLRMNHATVASVTALAISALSAASGNPNLRTLIATWDDSTSATRGTITLCKVGAPGTFAVFAVVGAITDNTTWLQIPVTHVGSSGAWSAADGIYAAFARAGDAGATGAAGPAFAGGSLTTAINNARATVASHATTADIWGAAGNQIDWTGTATTTAFPAAPQAGSERSLICAGACSFTAGANMLIDGVTSGGTVTLAANDIVTVRAVTTTQFRLSIATYNAPNDSRATVASHATTADIWGARGKQIDWTGTATTTAFPAAPRAGAERVLICAAACAFTAGANMLIDGVASGATVTCAANDTVIVRAVTTTQFKLSRVKYDGTPQAGATGSIVVLSATRDSAAATGNVAYTGAGGTPKSVEIHASGGVVNAWSIGTAKVGAQACTYVTYEPTSTVAPSNSNTVAVFYWPQAGAYTTATIASMDSDGFTLAWAKTGAPTGTMNLKFILRF